MDDQGIDDYDVPNLVLVESSNAGANEHFREIHDGCVRESSKCRLTQTVIREML